MNAPEPAFDAARVTAPIFDVHDALRRLPDAEIAYAHFNALRTTPSADDTSIRIGRTEAFVYVLDGSRPASAYYNRAFARAPDALSDAALDALPEAIVAVETRPADLSPESVARLAARGFVPQQQLCYLACVPHDIGHAGLAVEEIRNADAFLDLLELEGVPFPPTKRDAKRRYYGTPDFRAFVARAGDGTACGWSTLFVSHDAAFLANAYTRPECRRLGAHRALLAVRLRAAAALGLRYAFTDVEHQSQSHANCERAGLRTLTIDTIWARAR